MLADQIERECEQAMKKAVEFFRNELRTVRTGRASPALVEHLRIEVPSYGSTMELRELASITAPEPALLLIKPYDPTTIRDIERGILNSNLGITPNSDGKVVRLPIPPLSGERRAQLAAQVRKMAESQRVAVRNARREANRAIEAAKKEGTLPEDDAETLAERIQDLTKKYEKQIDELLEAKTREIEEV